MIEKHKYRAAFKEWLKQFICMTVCLITLLTPVSEAFAEDYKKTDSDEGATYYISDGKDFKKLFDFTLKDVPDILSWVFDFKTYTVIKEYENEDGDTVYKGYFNTPNLQMIVKNEVISLISDGYTDNTYDVNETEHFVEVGKNADHVNAITRYGFEIPSYTYMGEYPKEVMSPAGIVPSPKKWWEVLWRAIKALFGVSFLKAPDADSFNSIKYMNHEYLDKSDYVLRFFSKYYLKYFEDKLIVDEAVKFDDDGDADGTGKYFSGPEEVMDLTVTEKAKKAAEKYTEKYKDEYLSALQHYVWWYKYKDNSYSTVGMCSTDWFHDFRTSLSIDTLEEDDEEDMSSWYSDGVLAKLFSNTKWDLIDDTQKVDIDKTIYSLEGDTHPVDGWHYFAGREAYKKTFYQWLIGHLHDAYVIASSIPDDKKRFYYGDAPMYKKDLLFSGDSEFTDAASYGLNPESGSFDKGEDDDLLTALAADMVRYSYDYITAHYKYDKEKSVGTRTITRNTYTSSKHSTITYDIYYKNGSTSTGNVKTIDNVTYDIDGTPGWHENFGIITGEDGYDCTDDSPAFNYTDWEVEEADVEDNILYKDAKENHTFDYGHTEDTGLSDITSGEEYDGSYNSSHENEVDADVNIERTGCSTYSYGSRPDKFTEPFASSDDWKNINKIVITHIYSYDLKEVQEKKTDQSRTKRRNANFRFEALWNNKGGYEDATYKITSLSDYEDRFLKALDFDRYDIKVLDNKNELNKFNIDDLVHPDLQSIYKNYEQNLKLIKKFKKFNRYMARGSYDNETNTEDLADLDYIPYRQCLIYNTGEEGECKSQKFGDEDTTITVANAVVYSGVYKITDEYRDNNYEGDYAELSYEDAYTILTQLQIYCGPYYTDVLANMMKLMVAAAEKDDDEGPLTMMVEDDPRIMPYDTATMIKADKKNYTIPDPRVEMYKDHIIGGLVAEFTINYGFDIFIKPQKTIISLAGKVTELSVFLQTLCNFDFMDSIGLSPTHFWEEGNVFVSLLMIAVTIYFIVKTVIAIIKMGTRSLGKVLSGFVILVIELGFVACIAANPDHVWNIIKDVNNKLSTFGETSVASTHEDLDYLFGDAEDGEVMYYLPYLDCWSKYNTGYGLLDDEQLIDDSTDYRELADFENPQLDGQDIKHWSILLMDSFEYHGKSNSIVNTVQEDGQIMNGSNINSNAYRVVDHFLAPRVDITTGSDLHLEAVENENYNREFQSGVVDVLVKLANCCLGCFLSLIKTMIFLYFWWQMYMFIFNVVLGLGAEKKKFSTVLMETFMPMAALIVFGFYSAVCLTIGMEMEGLIGLLIIFFMFWLTIVIMKWWHDSSKHTYPFTLNWLYFLATMNESGRMSSMSSELADRQNNVVNGFDDWENGTAYSGEDDTRDRLERQTDFLFNDNGTLRKERLTDFETKDDAKRQMKDWYMQELAAKKKGRILSQKEIRAMNEFEHADMFNDIHHEAEQEFKDYGKRKAKANNKKINEQPQSTPDTDTTSAHDGHKRGKTAGKRKKISQSAPVDTTNTTSNKIGKSSKD